MREYLALNFKKPVLFVIVNVNTDKKTKQREKYDKRHKSASNIH